MIILIIIIMIIITAGGFLQNGTLHPVSITRFPLTRFSPGSGLLSNPFCS